MNPTAERVLDRMKSLESKATATAAT
jgi:hypothetical protein